MEQWLQQFMEFLPDGGSYLLVMFLIAFAESVPMVGLIVPGSTLIVFAGFLVLKGKCTLSLLIIVTTCGAFLGDLFSFWLGFYYGSKLLKLRSFQKHHHMVKRSEQFFVKHGGKSIFFARFLGPIRGITPFIAGLSGMSGRPFYGYALISAILWGICYPGIGYFGGQSWQQAQSLSVKFGLVIGVILLVVFFHQWIKHTFKSSGNS